MAETQTPRYHAIEQALRQRIRDLPAHTALPSESRLSAEFGVSRMTARGAVTRLVNAGLVYRMSGRGTFVAPPPSNRRADSLIRFTEQMRRSGRTATSRLLGTDTRAATEAERTDLRPGKNGVIEIRRIRLADATPIAVETAVFSATLSRLLDTDLSVSLHTQLARLGRVPTSGHATVTAESATVTDADLLDIPAGSAVLVERRLINDQHGHPLERTESRYAAERYRLDVVFDVDQT
ncbi:GntR family transcriptional regulator [Stackebrandtia nassauensis]|uniref:Transcriptional regulator, GntR family n=1 Tax=Stackebrandtia nassauensis (strain DSM 44728 / CIP 108903 / NRRL B-16338 / NBRC 102104 / LLR-40K-21) TaxID=446470 RepID=D3Q9J1_STANL|nr:GntR family transcriptional regulator [Stackebrandtia nassauensis]ADD42673.1 transcriptional regulator, GntR family [Stackebrandtia nassauensis DSM 44728]